MSVVAKSTVRVAGHRQLVKAGKVYEDNDPIVTERPDLFEPPEDYQRRKARPQSTAEMGHRSMLARRQAPAETARSAPGEEQQVHFPCPTKEKTGCEKTFETIRGAKAHGKAAHK